MNPTLLSIVICTYNRDKYLQKCLEHLTKQSADTTSFEVLVVDNNSNDQTSKIAEEFKRTNQQLNFRYILEKEQGLSFSRNRGVNESQSDLISFIDDDAFADESYVANTIAYFQSHPEVDAIGGKVTPVYENGEPDWMSPYLLPLVAALDKGKIAKPFKGRQFPIGANMAFRKSVLENFQPFNTALGRKGEYLGSGEEKDLFFRLKANKHLAHYVPEVHVSHIIPDKRLDTNYIKRMAQGIGKSEALRIKSDPFVKILIKWIQEFLKIPATAILALLYSLNGKLAKAGMLIKFRYWLFSSFMSG